jgi:hypothetical protein
VQLPWPILPVNEDGIEGLFPRQAFTTAASVMACRLANRLLASVRMASSRGPCDSGIEEHSTADAKCVVMERVGRTRAVGAHRTAARRGAIWTRVSNSEEAYEHGSGDT